MQSFDLEGIKQFLDLVHTLDSTTIYILLDTGNHIERYELMDAEIHDHMAEAYDPTTENVDEQSQATTASSQTDFDGP
jgi:hypothetical protein